MRQPRRARIADPVLINPPFEMWVRAASSGGGRRCLFYLQLSALGVPIAGFLSGLCGWFGMKMATNASARTTFAAKQSLNDGLRVAFRAGAVMGLCVTGFALLDVSVWFYLLTQVFDVGDLVAGL